MTIDSLRAKGLFAIFMTCFVLAISSRSIRAQPLEGVYIPSPIEPLPEYFAGTLNVAAGSIYTFPPPEPGQDVWMTEAHLFLAAAPFSFIEVDSWYKDPMSPGTTTAAVGVFFDSTHFADGAQVHILVTGKDNFNRDYQDSEIVTVRNKALLGNHSFPTSNRGSQSHDVVQSALGSRYSITKKLGNNLVQSQWNAALPGANFVYVSTHGSDDTYEMEVETDYNLAYYDNDPPPDNNHKQVLMATVGICNPTTLPPYNPSGIPPANFVFVDACETFKSDFSWTLYPKENLYDGTWVGKTVNIFTAGWNVKMKVGDTTRIAELIMAELVNGYPALNGLGRAVEAMVADGITTQEGHPLSFTMIGRHGDEDTKIAGVYTGNQTPTLDWYRQ